jgi:Holliday junction DNA helicase ruvB N-terminus.
MSTSPALQELYDAAFDAQQLYDLLTDGDNADTYRSVLERCIAYQEDRYDPETWDSSAVRGIEAGDVGAAGWELEQLRRAGVLTKTFSSNSGAVYRLASESGEGYVNHHEEAARVLELAESDTELQTSAAGGETQPTPGADSLADVDVDDLFTDVVGYDDEKKWYRRTLDKQEQVHHLLVGEPGSGKSMFLDSIVENVPGARRVVFTGNQSTAQGVVDILKSERPPVLVVEEIEKGDKRDREALMTLCGNGYIQETKGDGRSGEVIDLDTIVFAAGNQRSDITPESLVDRFLVWEYEQYTQDEFEEVCRNVLPRETGVDEETAEWVAIQMYEQAGCTSVRDAEDIARLVDDVAEVEQLVSMTVE